MKFCILSEITLVIGDTDRNGFVFIESCCKDGVNGELLLLLTSEEDSLVPYSLSLDFPNKKGAEAPLVSEFKLSCPQAFQHWHGPLDNGT